MLRPLRATRRRDVADVAAGNTCTVHQLSGLDASFLALETPTQTGHIASLSVFSLRGWSDPSGKHDTEGKSFFDAVTATVQERIHLIPLMRRRLVEVPLGLDHPYWIADANFDIEFHVRNLALPIPGSDEQLAEQVARIVSRPLDRSHPLWELYVIDGLANNRVGVLTKIHNAAIDGMNGVELLTTLLDADIEGRLITQPAAAFTGEDPPGAGVLAVRTALNAVKNPVKAARLPIKAVQAATGVARSAGAGIVSAYPLAVVLQDVPVLGKLTAKWMGQTESVDPFPRISARSAPKTPFNRAITAHRRFAFGSLELAAAKKVHKAFGVSVNDVLLALVAAALRRYLDERGELPLDSLIALQPITMLTDTEADAYTSKLSAVLVPLHTNLPDPQGRLAAIHESSSADTSMRRAVPAAFLTDIAQFAPPAVAARASRLITRTSVMNKVNPPFNVVVSNVPGPKDTLFTAGAPLEHLYPVPIIIEGQGLSITVQSYRDSLDFGIVTCRELVPDPKRLIAYLEEAMQEYVGLADAMFGDSNLRRLSTSGKRQTASGSKRKKSM